jgi:hypothetical protein
MRTSPKSLLFSTKELKKRKMIPLKVKVDGITTNTNKERLLLAYAFLKSKMLNMPECNIFNDSKNLPNELSIISLGGPDKEIPVWTEFYKVASNCDDSMIQCVAGCDEKDKARISIALFPLKTVEDLSAILKGIIPVSISEEVDKKKFSAIMDELKANYIKYKELCILC